MTNKYTTFNIGDSVTFKKHIIDNSAIGSCIAPIKPCDEFFIEDMFDGDEERVWIRHPSLKSPLGVPVDYLEVTKQSRL